MNGCKKCPAYAKCTETYRGSGCAALRYTYGLESDPKLDCTDREKLIELLNDVGSNVLQFPTDGFIAALADHLLKNGVTFATDTNVGSKWISVEDRLPADMGDVLVKAYWHERWQTMIGWQSDSGKKWRVYTSHGEMVPGGVTHWMPLPEPPKEEANE